LNRKREIDSLAVINKTRKAGRRGKKIFTSRNLPYLPYYQIGYARGSFYLLLINMPLCPSLLPSAQAVLGFSPYISLLSTADRVCMTAQVSLSLVFRVCSLIDVMTFFFMHSSGFLVEISGIDFFFFNDCRFTVLQSYLQI